MQAKITAQGARRASQTMAHERPSPETQECRDGYGQRPGCYEEALAWFDSEAGALLAAAARADDAGFRAHAWQIPCAAGVFFFRRGTGTARPTC